MGKNTALPVMALQSGLCKGVRPTICTSLSRPSTFLLAGHFLSLILKHVIIRHPTMPVFEFTYLFQYCRQDLRLKRGLYFLPPDILLTRPMWLKVWLDDGNGVVFSVPDSLLLCSLSKVCQQPSIIWNWASEWAWSSSGTVECLGSLLQMGIQYGTKAHKCGLRNHVSTHRWRLCRARERATSR